MRLINSIQLLVVVFVLLPVASQAQNSITTFSLDAGVKHTNSTGIGLDGRFNFGFSSFYVGLNPLNFNFVPTGTSDRYRSETTSDGRDICRDTSNGQFADKSNCATQFDTFYGFSTDINYLLRPNEFSIAVGLGYRLGKTQTLYGNIDIIFTENPQTQNQYWYLNLSGGQQLFTLGVGVAFGL